MIRGTFGPGTLVLGGGAVLLIAFLTLGFLLPGRWTARAETTVRVPPEAVLPYLDSPEGWREWTTWPDSVSRSGPERGAGATMSWNDPDVGTGSFRIEAAGPDQVRYAVAVEGVGGMMRTRGTFTLMPGGEGTTLRWVEEGDLGNNPLMGYWALFMKRAQGAELQKSLDRLAGILRSSPSPTR